jgi:hypothetical protein
MRRMREARIDFWSAMPMGLLRLQRARYFQNGEVKIECLAELG